MKTSELNYNLPESLIAQHPCEPRDRARMLVVHRESETIEEDVFANLGSYLHQGDCLALNDTRVIRARLHGIKPTGGHVEVFLLHERSPGEWTALVRPSARVKPGTRVKIGGIEAEIGAKSEDGRRTVHFDVPDVLAALEAFGEIPLPPYIHRDQGDPRDVRQYQTIYAEAPGAVAAPTAGLHFTPEVFAKLEDKGVDKAFLTLHVGYGTFKPIHADELEAHSVAPEDFLLSEEAAAKLNSARGRGGRIAAVGTTATRALETQYANGRIQPGQGVTDRYIYPPYEFRAVDVLQTNFHLPCSSLLALVCAFGGYGLIMKAYRHAVEKQFRFYSYGDVMLIL